MFGLGFTRELKQMVASRDNSIRIMVEQKKALESKCHEESLKVVRLAAENATLKSKLISEEDKYDNMVKFYNISVGRLELELEGFRLAELNRSKAINPVNVKKSGTVKVKSDKPINDKLQAYYNRGKKK